MSNFSIIKLFLRRAIDDDNFSTSIMYRHMLEVITPYCCTTNNQYCTPSCEIMIDLSALCNVESTINMAILRMRQ